jgi:hypothetical protein
LPKAKILFNTNTDESTLIGIDAQIEILKNANASSTGYMGVVVTSSAVGTMPAPNDNDMILTEHQVWALRQQCQYIAMTLQLAKENMSAWTWGRCCRVTMERLKKQGLTLATNHEIIAKWYRNFRKHRKFVLPINTKF